VVFLGFGVASTFTARELVVNPLRVCGLIWLTYAVSARRLAWNLVVLPLRIPLFW